MHGAECFFDARIAVQLQEEGHPLCTRHLYRKLLKQASVCFAPGTVSIPLPLCNRTPYMVNSMMADTMSPSADLRAFTAFLRDTLACTRHMGP